MSTFFLVTVSRGSDHRRFASGSVVDLLLALADFKDREEIDLLRVERIEPLIIDEPISENMPSSAK